MSIKINIPERTKKYMGLQCNNVLTDYTECKEITLIYSFLEKCHAPINVLELGAGIGRVSVFLRNVFDWADTVFYLLDGDSGEKQMAGMNYKIGSNFYNSMRATKDFCNANGIKDENLVLLNVEEGLKLPNNKFDFCYSCKAIGFHWPINDYLEMITPAIVKGGYLFFELRSTREQDYNDPKRVPRAKGFVDYQLRAIEKFSVYEPILLNTKVEYPIILLKKK